MSTVKSKKLQVGTDATSSNNFTIYQPATPDGTLRIGVGNADSPTEVGQFNANGYKPNSTVNPIMNVTMASNQSITSGVWVKMTFDTVDYDTTSDFNTSTYRYTPSVAGYYFVTASGFLNTNTSTRPVVSIWKNGGEYKTEAWLGTSALGGNSGNITNIVYLNGSTDYIEAYISQNTGSTITLTNNSVITYFQAHLIQQA